MTDSGDRGGSGLLKAPTPFDYSYFSALVDAPVQEAVGYIDPHEVQRLRAGESIILYARDRDNIGVPIYLAAASSESEAIRALTEALEGADDALTCVRAIVADAAMTGFNYKDGDWADRLFQSQQKTSRALSFARAAIERSKP